MPKIGLFLSKALLNFTSDLNLLGVRQVKLQDRLTTLWQKYVALLLGRRQVTYLNRPFFYDNYWMPALLQHYPRAIADILAHIDQKSVNSLLDIGANLGQFAATFKYFLPKLRVVSFEPNKDIFPLLLKNLDTNWKAVALGVGPERAKVDFYYVPSKSAQGSLYAANAQERLLTNNTVATSIDISPLDQAVCKEHDLPRSFDFIKIDTEGAEALVLQGLEQIRWHYMYIEIANGREGAISEEQVWGLLTRSGHAKPKLLFRSAQPYGAAAYDLLIENTSYKAE